MGTHWNGANEWEWPTREKLAALERVHRGERRRPRWVRLLERLFGVPS